MRLGFKKEGNKVYPVVADTGEEVECENCNVYSSIENISHVTITYGVPEQESERIENDDRLAAREEAGRL